MGRPRKENDLRGEIFGVWTVLEFNGMVNYRPKWLCECECGIVAQKWQVELCQPRMAICQHRKVKVCSKPEYSVWQGIKQRCTNRKNPRWNDYGGRGIRICDRWKNSFISFLEDMGPRPSFDYQCDRIDNDGNYEPGNCRWVTAKENVKSRRRRRGNPVKPKTPPINRVHIQFICDMILAQ